ncbi:acyltransferase [Rhizobium herbae]|uniref:Acyltransferase n=1 Tax=Rhizobium herbae TaxID=508661 RepID=A0ABS7HDJ0_9HYPH|nr:acyltransferase [Rhizobium herbae]MBW9064771.1 acyltransferase [Rhizobium herbae]
MATKPKLLALESLRGFAAIAVALHHFRYGSLLSENTFIRHSYLMVDFFFVLSGFVIALSYANRLASPADLASFQRRRFWRLYPLHLFTLLAFLGIECLKYIFEQKTGIASNSPAFVVSDSSAFLANVFLLQGVVLAHPGFNIPSWSISVEFWTYLIFALTMGLLRLRMRWCLVLAALAAIFLLSLEGGRLQTDPMFAIIRCIYSFFLGAWAASLQARFSRNAPAAITAAALALIVLATSGLGGSRAEILLPPLFAVAVVAVANLRGDTALRRFLEWPFFVWLGTISYSVYLTHSIIGWVVTQVLRFGMTLPTVVAANGDTMLALDQSLGTLSTLVAVAAVLAVSHLTFHLIETPFRSGWPFGAIGRLRVFRARG